MTAIMWSLLAQVTKYSDPASPVPLSKVGCERWRRRRTSMGIQRVLPIFLILTASIIHPHQAEATPSSSGSGGVGGGSLSSNLISGGGGGSGKTDAFRHRFKGLDRILNRLDGGVGGGSESNHENPSENHGSLSSPSGAGFGKDYYQRSSHHLHHRTLDEGGATGSGNLGRGMALSSSKSFDNHNQPQTHHISNSNPSHHHPFPASTRQQHSWASSAKDFNEEDEEEDEEMDDEDSYEDELDEMDNTTDNGELLNDKMSHWASNYKNRYLAQRKSPPTTTTTTTTTTTPAPQVPMSYSQWKWQQLGTRQGLEQYRRQMASSSTTNPSVNSNNNHNSNNNNFNYKSRTNGHGGTGNLSPRYGSGGAGSSSHHHQHQHAPSQQSSSSSSPAGSHGGQWSNGNRAQPQSPGAAVSEAVRHAWKVRREGDCKIPQARIVRVQDFYPNPGKSYVPHCTILHHCSDDTGCCRHDVLTCAPKTTQRVELAFYAITVDQSRVPMVEKLVFYNHTECECRDKLDEMMPRDSGVHPTSLSDPYHPSFGFPAGMVKSGSGSGTPSSSASSSVSGGSARRNSITEPFQAGNNGKGSKNSLCKCPSDFTERILSDGSSCSCDCFDKEKSCLRLKRGRDFFPFQDKWCIQSGRCEVPECAYGPYIHLIGRCPRKRERSGETSSWTRYLTQ